MTRVTHHVHDDRRRCVAWSHEHWPNPHLPIPLAFRWEPSPCTGRRGP